MTLQDYSLPKWSEACKVEFNWAGKCRLNAQKARVEEYFARQMGMTVPQWRDAQAGILDARGVNEIARDRARRWLRAGRPAPPAPEWFR